MRESEREGRREKDILQVLFKKLGKVSMVEEIIADAINLPA